MCIILIIANACGNEWAMSVCMHAFVFRFLQVPTREIYLFEGYERWTCDECYGDFFISLT